MDVIGVAGGWRKSRSVGFKLEDRWGCLFSVTFRKQGMTMLPRHPRPRAGQPRSSSLLSASRAPHLQYHEQQEGEAVAGERLCRPRTMRRRCMRAWKGCPMPLPRLCLADCYVLISWTGVVHAHACAPCMLAMHASSCMHARDLVACMHATSDHTL